MFEPLYDAFFFIMQPSNLLGMLIGTIIGIIFGAIPGLTGGIAIVLIIPFTYGVSPLAALAVIAGLHNGSSYGGAVPAVLLGIPGHSGAICTTFDGHPMAQQGFALRALKIAAVSSAFGGVISALCLMFMAPPLAEVSLAFGPAEIFWLCVFGLSSIAVLISDDPIKGLLASCFGIIVSLVGIDAATGYARYNFGFIELTEKFHLAVIMVGMYAISMSWDMAQTGKTTDIDASLKAIKTKKDHMRDWPWRSIWGGWARSIPLGVLVGILPGVGGSVAGFIAYNEAKRASKDPDSFGKGNPVGVAIAESANNADNAAVMIPALTLGIPGSGVAALIMGGLMVHGLQPGPDLFLESPDIVFGFMWALLITSVMLFPVGGVIATRIFAKILNLPPTMLLIIITSFCFIGIYAIGNSMFNVYITLAFGFIGYAFRHLNFPIAPAVLGLVLGEKAEYNFNTAMNLGLGNPMALVDSTISIVIACLIALVLLRPLFGYARNKWWVRASEDD